MFLVKPERVGAKVSGFTLLELLIVVAILSSLSFMALTLLDNKGNDHRLKSTKDKIAAIRLAIVGDSTRVLNRESEVSGFIADIGVPPRCLEDLFRQNSTCGGSYPSSEYVDPSSDSMGHITGWRGPYLPGTEEDYSDGWGRLIEVTSLLPSLSITQDPITGAFRSGSLKSETIAKIFSYGRDGIHTVNASTTNPFDYDITDNISSSQAYVPLQGMLVHFGTATAGCYGFDGAGGNITALKKVLTIASDCNELPGANWTKEEYAEMQLNLRFPTKQGALADLPSEKTNPNFFKKSYIFPTISVFVSSSNTTSGNSTLPSNTTTTANTTTTDSVALYASQHDPEKYVYFKMNGTTNDYYYVPKGTRSVQVMQNSTSVYPAELTPAPSELPVLFLPGASLGPISWIYGKQY